MQEAIFLFRDGSDDYTIWVVDLPENEVAEIQYRNGMIRGTLESLMSQIPITTEKTANRLQMLGHCGREYVLYSRDVPYTMLEKYQADGCSVRGSKESVLSELEMCFLPQDVHRQSRSMT